MKILVLASAPVFIILFYIYYRDKYEKEPFNLLAKSLITGILIAAPVYFLEKGMSHLIEPFNTNQYIAAFNNAFLVASLCEESFKLLAILLLVWNSKHFNERFDGIVYAVFISLGFALIENLLYVFNAPNAMEVAYSRAITAVPAHAMFGIMMGFHLGIAKFSSQKVNYHLSRAFFIPFFFHGLYDFILMSQNNWLLAAFTPLLIYLFIRVKKRLTELSEISQINEEEPQL